MKYYSRRLDDQQPIIRIDGAYMEAACRWQEPRVCGRKEPDGLATIGDLRAQLYEWSIKDLLNAIGKCSAGLAVLVEIEARGDEAGKTLTISPFTLRDRTEAKKESAWAFPVPGEERDAAPAERRSPFAGDMDDRKTRDWDERYNRTGIKGTGKGCNELLHFSPDKWQESAPFGKGREEVLFHELVHAMRDMQGTSNPVPTEGTCRDYDNEEEFLAILVTNIYMSEKGITQLRENHAGFHPLPDRLATSAGFLSDRENCRLIKKLFAQENRLFETLATAVSPVAVFNPLREYFANPFKYP